MRKTVSSVVMAGLLSAGCSSYAINQREEVQSRNPMLLERVEKFSPKSASLNDSTLVMVLDRTCEERYRVDEQRLRIEEVRYVTDEAWGATMGIGGAGLLVVAPTLWLVSTIRKDDAEFCEGSLLRDCDPAELKSEADALNNAAIGTAAASAGLMVISAIVLLLIDNSTFEKETVLSQEGGERVDTVACSGSFPSGNASLHAPAIGERYEGEIKKNGQVMVDLTTAPASFWSTRGALQLELPGRQEWVPIELPDEVRQAGLERFGEDKLQLSLSFSDEAGNRNGRLDAGERGAIAYEIENAGESTAHEVKIELSMSDARGVTLDTPVLIGDLSPGQRVEGTTALIASAEVTSAQAVIDGVVRSDQGEGVPQRLRVDVDAFKSAERVYVINEKSKKYNDLLAAGTTRLQSVLTETRRYAFVTDDATRSKITKIVDEGGGSPEERRKKAIAAARAENISKVFQYSLVPLVGTQVQLVLTVYDTTTGDQIFLKDTPTDVQDAYKALEAFETLARAYMDWTRQP